MIHSFRLRLALISALLTGLALLVFGAGSWWLIRESKIQRLDTELRADAEREVSRERTPAQWETEAVRLASRLGLREPQDLLLLVQDNAGQVHYQSGHWPAAWDPSALPWPSATEAGSHAWRAPSLMGSAVAAPLPHGPEGWPPPRPGPPPFADARPNPFGPPSDARAPLQQPNVADPPPVAREQALPPPDPPPPALMAPRGKAPTVVLAQRPIDGRVWRMALARTETAQLLMAVNAEVIQADMRGIRNAFLLCLPLALMLTGMAGWAFANRAMAPIDKLVQAARSVTAGGLEQRIAAQGEDREFVVLIDMFNRMLARLERSFQQAYRFTADAAHELKTPLAIVQGQLERALQQAGDGSAMQTALSSILDEVRRLSVISRKLLLLSQADAGHLSILREPVELSRLLEELLEDTRMLAPQLQVDADIKPGLRVHADASLLRQVLHNLISNAIKYNVPGGRIQIGSARWGHSVEVLVSNTSHGITAAQRTRLFERFFRGDQAHGRSVEGVGLGLSVSREIARAHGGDLTLKGESQGMVQFSLVLPV